jgi:GNAT superfamily N-acetyltransferase
MTDLILPLETRPFSPTDTDYAAVIAVDNAIWPDNPMVLDELKHTDKHRDTNYLYQRLMMVWEGSIVGFAYYRENPYSYQPGKYRISIQVHPDFEGRGIGTAVYNHILARLQQQKHKPVLLESGTRDTKPQSVRFLEKRGFTCVMRWLRSELDLTQFDPTKFGALFAKLATQGIELVPLPQLQLTDPEWQQKIYELDWELTLDEPTPNPPTKLPFDQFVKEVLDGPAFLADAWVIGVENGRYVGMSNLEPDLGDNTRFQTGFTGVVRSHRRRGLATALKMETAVYAKTIGQETGKTQILTTNEENNPMYDLNVKLGFRQLDTVLAYEKEVSE